MMNYRPNKRARRPIQLLLIILVFLMLSWWLVPATWWPTFSRAATSLATPGFAIGDYLSNVGRTFRSFFHDKQKLQAENEALRRALDQQLIIELERDRLQKENDELHVLLNREPSARPFTYAQLTAPHNRSPYDTLLINVGAPTDGTRPVVKVGDLVAIDNLILGSIAEVYPETSKVELFASQGRRIPVVVGEAQLMLEATGHGGGNFSLSLPRDLELKVGDSLYYTSNDRQWLLAIIAEVKKDATDFFQEVLAYQPINFNQIKWLEIYEGHSDNESDT